MKQSILIAPFCAISTALAWQPPFLDTILASARQQARAAAVAAALATTLVANDPAWASSTAAQISLNSLPPANVNIAIQDLPVIGNLISGTYTKVASIKGQPSVTIASPPDKVKAVQELATSGHLEFDVAGIIKTHLDVDVASDEAGVLKVRIASNLIPKLPFKNLASSSTSGGALTGGRASQWNMVTNMGSKETYYYNEKTGVTQYERPDKF
jgi:hypothetical protein